ncbi:MAG: type II secretion system minor pseudopilin GspK [Pseudomonadota bacterium]
MRSSPSRKHQQGAVAIFFALLIVIVTTSVAVAVSYDMALDTRRTQSLLWQEQARLVAYGAEDWISDVLRQDTVDTSDDHLGELWAQELPVLPVDGAGVQGLVAGSLEDLQGRYNINNLVDPGGQPVTLEVERFRRLLQLLQLDPQLADAVVDWIDTDNDISFPGGAEDDVYSGRIPANRTANQPFRSIGELAIVEGFDTEAVDKLRPLLTALPKTTQVNANTAPALVLAMMGDNISAQDVEFIIEDRLESGIEDLDQVFGGFMDADAIGALTTATEFFGLRTVVRIGTVRFTMYSLIYRSTDGQTAVLLRSFGNEY